MSRPVALTIAGSDSGGGAGLQADLKAFHALGVHGTTVVTAVTAQNSLGVSRIHPIPPAVIAAQLDAVFTDMRPDAVKIGMLRSVDAIRTAAGRLRRYGARNVVLDPVMRSTAGGRAGVLLQERAVRALVEELLPLAAVVTPNLAEACRLLGAERIATVDEMIAAAEEIHRFGPRHVVLKGGHLDGDEAVDVWFDGRRATALRHVKLRTRHTHGTGCTFASAIAAGLARGLAIEPALRLAKAAVTAAIRGGYALGGGAGPVDVSAVHPPSPLLSGPNTMA